VLARDSQLGGARSALNEAIMFGLALLLSAPIGARAVVVRGRINPELHPESDKVFFRKDFPHDMSPTPMHKFDHPFPIVQDSEDYDKDYVKDENADGGEWAEQEKYDRLRSKLAAAKSVAQQKHTASEADEKKLTDLRDKERELEEKLRTLKEKQREAKEAAAKKVEAAEAKYNATKAKKHSGAANATAAEGSVEAAEEKVEAEEADVKNCEKELEEAKARLAELEKAAAEAAAQEAKAAAAEKEAKEIEERLARAEADADHDFDSEKEEYRAAKAKADAKEAGLKQAEEDYEAAGEKLRKIRQPEPAKQSGAGELRSASLLAIVATVACQVAAAA